MHFFHFKSHLQTKLKWTCTERLQNSYISWCFSQKEIISYNKNIVQLIFQFGSVNSRNLSPLTDQSWLRRLFNEQPQCGGKLAPSLLLKSPNLELLNLSILFSLVKLVFRLRTSVSDWKTDGRNRWGRCTKRTAIKPGFELYPCMLTLSLLLDWCRLVLLEYAKIKQVKQSGLW